MENGYVKWISLKAGVTNNFKIKVPIEASIINVKKMGKSENVHPEYGYIEVQLKKGEIADISF